MSSYRRRAPATFALLLAILVGFAIEIVTGAWTNGHRLAQLGAITPDVFHRGEYWRLLTAMFLHGDGTLSGDFLHILANMWGLYQLGTLYEIMFGTRRFLFIYFVAGLAASLTSAWHSLSANTASVGASGAILGILGAFIFSLKRSPRWRNDPLSRSLLPQFVFWIAINVGLGLQVAQIDNAAHIGGLVSGLLLGLIPHRVPPPPPSQNVIEVTPAAYKPPDGGDSL